MIFIFPFRRRRRWLCRVALLFLYFILTTQLAHWNYTIAHARSPRQNMNDAYRWSYFATGFIATTIAAIRAWESMLRLHVYEIISSTTQTMAFHLRFRHIHAAFDIAPSSLSTRACLTLHRKSPRRLLARRAKAPPHSNSPEARLMAVSRQ